MHKDAWIAYSSCILHGRGDQEQQRHQIHASAPCSGWAAPVGMPVSEDPECAAFECVLHSLHAGSSFTVLIHSTHSHSTLSQHSSAPFTSAARMRVLHALPFGPGGVAILDSSALTRRHPGGCISPSTRCPTPGPTRCWPGWCRWGGVCGAGRLARRAGRPYSREGAVETRGTRGPLWFDTAFHRLSPPVTAFHRLSPPFTAFHRILLPFTAVHRGSAAMSTKEMTCR